MNKSNYVGFIITKYFFICLLVCPVYSQGSVNDSCTIEEGNEKGICTSLRFCEPALTNLQKNNIFPQICGYNGTVPIVCCEQHRPVTTKLESKPGQISEQNATKVQRRVGEISKQKCKEYEWGCHKQFVSPTLVIGGKDALVSEFPHMALIGFDSPDGIKWQCGGSLISENYVLTAGHCLFSRDFKEAKYVRMGITNINDKDYVEEFPITNRLRHPEYQPPSRYNDIGLVKFQGDIKFHTSLRPACLFTEDRIPVGAAIATGWGRLGYDQSSSEDLQKVNLDIIDNDTCNQTYTRQLGRKLLKGIVGEIQICAGSYTEKKDTCQGDSGGPLQIHGEDYNKTCTYHIIGVTSFGKPCGIVNSPGIYSRISAYLKWIEDTALPQ